MIKKENIEPNIYLLPTIKGNAYEVKVTVNGIMHNKTFKTIERARSYIENVRATSVRDNFSYPLNLVEILFGDDDSVDIDYIETHFDENLLEIIKVLTPREEKFFLLYFKEGLTLKAIGHRMGITPERIRQIVAKALRRLKHPARIKYLRYGKDVVAMRDNIALLEKQLAGKIISLKQEINNATISSNMDTHFRSIDELDFTVRTHNCLRRNGINTIGDLLAFPEDKLMTLRNFGRRSYHEVILKKNQFKDTNLTVSATLEEDEDA